MATNRGVVDLSKVREAKDKRRAERIKRAAHMHKAMAKKRDIANAFKEVYEENFNAKYDLRPERFTTRKTGKNTFNRSRTPSDLERLWAIFKYIKTRYEGTVDSYKEYLAYIFDVISELEKITKQGVIGFIEKEERIDEFFFNERRKQQRSSKARNVRGRAQEHSEYFDDE